MSFDRQLEQAEKKISALAERAGDATSHALNRAAIEAKSRAVDEITKQVALDKSYVRERLKISKTKKDETGYYSQISAQNQGVLLTRFPYAQTFGPRKSGVGQKATGIKGRIKTNREYQSNFFLMPLKNSNTMGIAKRTKATGRDNYRVLHAPSVAQVFNTVREDISPEVIADIQKNLMRELEKLYG